MPRTRSRPRGRAARPLPPQPPQPHQRTESLLIWLRLTQLAMQPVEERERLLRPEEATHLRPLTPRQLGYGRGDLLGRPGAVVQLTTGAEDLQCGVDDPPARFRLLEPCEGGLRLRPRRARRRRHAPRVAALLSRLSDLTGDDLGLFPEPFHAAPTQTQDTPGLPRRVEDVPAVLQQGLLALAALLLHPVDPGLQARARIGHDVSQRGPFVQRREPGGALTIIDLLAEEPDHAGRFHPHQDRAVMEEDLIEAANQDQRPALPVEVLEDTGRLLSGRLDPALDRRSTGACFGAQDQGQQGEDLIEAQAHRRGRDGELVLLARGELDGLSEPVPESGILLAEALVLLDQFGVRRSAGVLGLDGGLDLLGVVVDGLSATLGRLGLTGDFAVHAGEARGGVGDPGCQGYLEHGVGLWRVDAVSNPTLQIHPLARSRRFGLAFQSVNLRSADFAQSGMIPLPPVMTLCPKVILWKELASIYLDPSGCRPILELLRLAFRTFATAAT